MFALLFDPAVLPFSVALTVFAGLLVLELLAAALGGTLLGLGADSVAAPEVDVDLPDLNLDLDGIDGTDLDLSPPATGPATPVGAAAWLGLGRMPAVIWLACMLAGFGGLGVTIQTAAQGALGWTLPPALAAAPALAGAIALTRAFGAGFARLLPSTETESVSERHLGRRRGTITQGTARRGRPAEVRVADRHGNMHYLRAEPLRDGEEIPQGAEVLVLRHRPSDGYRLVALSEVLKDR